MINDSQQHITYPLPDKIQRLYKNTLFLAVQNSVFLPIYVTDKTVTSK